MQMKIHAVYDDTGKILVAVKIAENEGPVFVNGGAGKLRPVPKAGQRSADLDVPAEFRSLRFAEACSKLRVQHGPNPTLVPKA
jgi:hypothetical protein